MTRMSNGTYVPDLEDRELRELVGLLLAVEHRAEHAFEEARDANATGDAVGKTAAMTQLQMIRRSTDTLAREIRAIDPDFPLLKVDLWFAERQNRAA